MATFPSTAKSFVSANSRILLFTHTHKQVITSNLHKSQFKAIINYQIHVHLTAPLYKASTLVNWFCRVDLGYTCQQKKIKPITYIGKCEEAQGLQKQDK